MVNEYWRQSWLRRSVRKGKVGETAVVILIGEFPIKGLVFRDNELIGDFHFTNRKNTLLNL